MYLGFVKPKNRNKRLNKICQTQNKCQCQQDNTLVKKKLKQTLVRSPVQKMLLIQEDQKEKKSINNYYILILKINQILLGIPNQLEVKNNKYLIPVVAIVSQNLQ